MSRVVMVIVSGAMAACGGSGAAGDELVCIPEATATLPGGSGPPVVFTLLARKSDVIAVEFGTFEGQIFDPAVKVWHKLSTAPAATFWTVAPDDSLLSLNGAGLWQSITVDNWSMIGPGLDNAGGGQGLGILGAQTDGSYWAFTENAGMFRLAPGASAWTPIYPELTGVREVFMTRDGTIWAARNITGSELFRIPPDGSAPTLLFDCADPELLYCTGGSGAARLAINERGDLFYMVTNRFFKVDAKTLASTEIGALPDDESYVNGVSSIAAVDDVLYVTTRDSYVGGEAHLRVLEPGGGVTRTILQTQSNQSEVVTARDGSHVYTHSPGVCELR